MDRIDVMDTLTPTPLPSREMECKMCGYRDFASNFVTLRYNKRPICVQCAIKQTDEWIRRYVRYDDLYRVFDKKAYAEINTEYHKTIKLEI